jgi:predicted RNase H-like HicB family nuclease
MTISLGQGNTQEEAISTLKEAIKSFQSVYKSENVIYTAPISTEQLHEFLAVEDKKLNAEVFELR